MDSLALLTKRLDDGSTSSCALVEQSLARITAIDAGIGAFLHVDSDGARRQAHASDERRKNKRALSPLDGVPLALKDNIACEGAPLTAGSRILEGYRAPYDATVTARLKGAGAVLVGRLNCDEFAMGSSNENSAFSPVHNPHDVTRVPGGSSGGSAAAVAAGMVAGALGSDTGGSVRQPAALCGVVGVKPSYGRVSRYGLIAFASSLDVIGPLARDVESAATLFEVIAGHDGKDATSSTEPVGDFVHAATSGADRGLTGVRVGVPRALLGHGVQRDVARVFDEVERALRDAGAIVVDVDLPHAPQAVATYYVLCTAEASSNLARYDGVRYGPRRGAEHGLVSMYEQTRALFGDEVKRRLVLGSWVLSAGYYDAYVGRAQRVRALVARDFDDAFARCDVILTPTSPEPAWKIGDKTGDPLSMYLADVYTVPASLAGLPALSLNAGFSTEGLPIGVQLVARAFAEERLLSAAAALERVFEEVLGLSSSIVPASGS
ncbi:MAG TPA: Asp-tRNA(Asn)/Glu-tRNA(Gln) amidotransferase subunit GatA [Myxococcota bacterium]